VAASYLDLFTNLFLMGTALAGVIIFAVFLGEVAIYRPVSGDAESTAEEEVRKTFANYVRGPSLVILDMGLICLAYIAAYLVKFEGEVPPFDRERMLESLPVVIIAQSVCFRAFRLYQGIWRYFGVRDLLSILKAVLSGTAIAVGLVVVFFRFAGYSRAVFVIDAMALFLLTAGSRFLFRALLEARRFPLTGKRVLVIGAGDEGELCLRALRTRNGSGYLPVGILDPDLRLRGRKLLGVSVLGPVTDLEPVAKETRAEEIVLSGPLPEETAGEIRAVCDRLGLPLYVAPVSRDFVRI
jgi:UDP-GlcNAc:undecaprenyl-phosphate GlcNAc-1-phosphate transferase